AVALVDSERPAQRGGAVRDFAGGAGRHVARTLHYRRHQPASRLPALGVEDVLPDAMGLDDVLRVDRLVPDSVLFVHSLSAHDFDFRDAGTRPQDDRGARGLRTVASDQWQVTSDK